MTTAERRMLFDLLTKVSKDMSMTANANVLAWELRKELALAIVTEEAPRGTR